VNAGGGSKRPDSGGGTDIDVIHRGCIWGERERDEVVEVSVDEALVPRKGFMGPLSFGQLKMTGVSFLRKMGVR
jgi:hypothetical protein